jgi:hypothetical protein
MSARRGRFFDAVRLLAAFSSRLDPMRRLPADGLPAIGRGSRTNTGGYSNCRSETCMNTKTLTPTLSPDAAGGEGARCSRRSRAYRVLTTTFFCREHDCRPGCKVLNLALKVPDRGGTVWTATRKVRKIRHPPESVSGRHRVHPPAGATTRCGPISRNRRQPVDRDPVRARSARPPPCPIRAHLPSRIDAFANNQHQLRYTSYTLQMCRS